MNHFIDPFLDNGFLQRALFAGVLVSLTCAVVGTYVVLRGMAFIGDALAHGVLPGVAGTVDGVACHARRCSWRGGHGWRNWSHHG